MNVDGTGQINANTVVLQTFYMCSFFFPRKIFIFIHFFQTLSVCILNYGLSSFMYAIERTLQLVKGSLTILTCSLPNLQGGGGYVRPLKNPGSVLSTLSKTSWRGSVREGFCPYPFCTCSSTELIYI